MYPLSRLEWTLLGVAVVIIVMFLLNIVATVRHRRFLAAREEHLRNNMGRTAPSRGPSVTPANRLRQHREEANASIREQSTLAGHPVKGNPAWLANWDAPASCPPASYAGSSSSSSDSSSSDSSSSSCSSSD